MNGRRSAATSGGSTAFSTATMAAVADGGAEVLRRGPGDDERPDQERDRADEPADGEAGEREPGPTGPPLDRLRERRRLARYPGPPSPLVAPSC